jgi:23S rRNA pseudouridine2605 synthase
VTARGDRVPERLHKYLASCGLGSRRTCEEIILAGRVTVNGQSVTELGVLVEPGSADVRVDGRPVLPEPTAYYLLHKPTGYLSTTRDERGRPTVLDLVPRAGPRLFIAGRLDVDSEGLLLVTNDGELTGLLTHPRYGVPKTYRATVTGELTWRELRQLREGVALEDGPASATEVSLLRCTRSASKADVTVLMGRKRMVRRMFTALGFEVTKLRRIRMGLLELGRLPQGAWRPLQAGELDYVLRLRLYRSHETALEHLKRRRTQQP